MRVVMCGVGRLWFTTCSLTSTLLGMTRTRLVGGLEARRAHADRLHVPHLARRELDAVADPERAVEHEGEAREHVGQGVLGGQAHGERAHSQGDDEGLDVHAEVLEDRDRPR